MMASLLVETGKALYGERWQSDLARDLNVSYRTMHRWVAGEYDTKPDIYVDLHRLVVERQALLDRVERRLKEVGS